MSKKNKLPPMAMALEDAWLERDEIKRLRAYIESVPCCCLRTHSGLNVVEECGRCAVLRGEAALHRPMY